MAAAGSWNIESTILNAMVAILYSLLIQVPLPLRIPVHIYIVNRFLYTMFARESWLTFVIILFRGFVFAEISFNNGIQRRRIKKNVKLDPSSIR